MRCVAWTLCVVVLSVIARGQTTVTIGTGVLNNAPTTYPSPYGNAFNGAKHQFLIRATELIANGMPAGGAAITSVAWNVAQVFGQAPPNFQISLGHTTATTLSGGYATGLTPVFGPVPHTPVVGWNTHVLTGSFVWNGTSNLVVETCFETTSSSINCLMFNSNVGFQATRYEATNTPGVCSATTSLGVLIQRPNTRFTVLPPTPPWQTNRPGSSLSFDGNLSTGFAKATVTRCGGNILSVAFGTNAPASLAEVALSFAPTVALGAGATPLGSQIINLNLGAPGFSFLNGGAGPLFLPAFGNLTLPLSVPMANLTLAAQQVVIDGSMPDGYSLSQAAELLATTGSVLNGPTGDDSFLTVNLTNTTPFCGPGMLPFFGTAYTEMHVSSNGKVIFGTPNINFAPAVATAMTDSPAVVVWNDLDPSVAGTIVTSRPNPNQVRVQFTGVRYFATLTANTFAFVFDTNGTVAIDGLMGVMPLNVVQMVGISAGSLGATDPGATAFSLGGPNIGPAGLGMIYALGNAGSLTPGLNQLVFTPSGVNPGNYDWAGF